MAMELNWAHPNRWQAEEPSPADPQAPHSLEEAEVDAGEAGQDGPGQDGPGPRGVGQNGAGQNELGWQGPGNQVAGNKKGRRRREGPPLAWLRRVNFRSRISVLVGVAVGISVALASLVSYLAVSHQLEQQVTVNLQSALTEVPSTVHVFGPGLDPRPFINMQLQTGDQIQIIIDSSSGTQIWSVAGNEGIMTQTNFFAVSSAAKNAFAEGPSGPTPEQTMKGLNGSLYRVETVGVFRGLLAVQIGYPLTNVDNTLAFLRFLLIAVALGGVALAAALGWAVGRASIRPVEDLTLAAEHVTATEDLSATIDEEGNDELARLAHSFNAMLVALASSRDKQAQLVSDAGHELRTPLTSLRTNIEVLIRTKGLEGPDRDALLADVDAQLQELTTLVGDLVDLARYDERPPADPESVAFDELVERAVERAHRRATSVHFEVSLEPGQVRAQPALLERAVMNVLDNAAKWSPPGGRVWVKLEAIGAWHLTVTDEGPGIAPEDLPHVFERFYRASTARSMPGSGLGLAIVKGVVTSHGGNISVTSPPDGGTRVEIVLPLDGSPSLLNGNGSIHTNGQVGDQRPTI
jgi:two-component system, OmpR family, sensor histidine kinase MprB